jgi:sterol desaturase/sphingolipid hydroxylase (fatty acid hydroxylase superfamily)
VKSKPTTNTSTNRDQPHKTTAPYYRIKELLAGVAMGTSQQTFYLVAELLGLNISVATYTYAYECRPCTFPIKAWPVTGFICVMLLKDLLYYFSHRHLHEYHAMWAAHAVHHSGEDYNLGYGARF